MIYVEPLIAQLSIKTYQEIPSDIIDPLSDMAGKLPFEKKRTNVLGLDREQHFRERTKNLSDTQILYTASYPDTVAGCVLLERIQTGPDERFWIVQSELVQRNREDIRRKLYQQIMEDHPNSTGLLTYPAQNRTARQEMKNYPFLKVTQSTVLLQYGTQLTDREDSGEKVTIPSKSLQTPENELFETKGSTQSPFRREKIKPKHGLAIDVSYFPIPGTEAEKTASIQSMKSNGTEACDFLGLHHHFRDRGFTSIEWTIENGHPVQSSLTKAGYQLINKRYRLVLRDGFSQ